eukprot:TRINITY_DN394_c0_g2_i2.p1 TRINITY_DN394_c0_g2~~TRINITY_DN394_c0_g2_i2.p1  ORF type:complete len:703 (-),score=114.45 TRINITY_DN394_c0_g2_i2:78-1964(-)
MPTVPHYRRVMNPNVVANQTWEMPKVFTPQVDWLLSIFENNMPKSYLDVLPTGKSYWTSHSYLSSGAFDYNGTRLALDHQIAVQERSLTHVGLNLYDGGVWAVALALSGLSDFVDIYHRNVLMTSSTGSNPTVNGLKSIRAWEPNPDPVHPPDLFYYGRDAIPNTQMKQVTLPNNLSFVLFQDGCTCPTAGCCAQEGKKQIPGNYFYRMIGPSYLLTDPLEGYYGYQWRATPVGINPDPAQWWNAAGVIHWNDWKPITGENVWAAILAPIQTLFIRNCGHLKPFSTFDTAPAEIQLAVSIMPAIDSLRSALGSLYHCPKGAKMFPPDPSEETNVSNENNFSAWAALKALYFILTNYYSGGDITLDYATSVTKKAIAGLENWFQNYLMPAPIRGENVISQGGHVSFDGHYSYQQGAQAFAVDCQTWGLLVVGSKKFDATHGANGVSAYGVWQSTKKLAGYYINGQLAGVGYTTSANTSAPPDIWSGEWTWGAVFMTRKLSYEYQQQGKTAWASSLLADSNSMIQQMEQAVKQGVDGVWSGGGLVQPDGSYLYANKRFFIPWGWYANPLGATSSTAWAVFNDWNYNPFVLGGFFPPSGSQPYSTSFYSEQCRENPPDPSIFTTLSNFYGY